MSDNYNDKDIERIIFRDGLASSEIEPSEGFWNKSFENILQRENSVYLNRVSLWRGALLAMGAVIIMLGAYAIYIHNEVNDIKQQLTKVESTQVKYLKQETQQTNAVTTSESLHKNTRQLYKTTRITSVNNTLPGKESRRTSSRNINSSDSTLPITKQQIANSPSTRNTTETAFNKSIPTLNKGISNENITEPQSTDNTSSKIIGNNRSLVQSSVAPITKPIVSNKKADSSVTSLLDSTNSLYPEKIPITLAGILSKSSISVFYAPGMTDDFLNDKNNDPTNTITANELKTIQDGDGTFALGLRLAYDISDKWTIQTGCYYSEYSYNINSTVIYAQQQETGQVGYSITTTSGTVFLPYSAGPTHIGDSIKVKGSSSRGYLSIPLQAKYKFIADTKLGFYITGGFSINIADYEETEIHWENTALEEGDLSVQSIYGLNTIQYSYNLGLGAEYLIRRGLSAYAEPFVNGSVTSINKNTPVITYPYFFGLALGITYHF